MIILYKTLHDHFYMKHFAPDFFLATPTFDWQNNRNIWGLLSTNLSIA